MPAPSSIQLNIHNGAPSEEGPFARVTTLPGAGGDCLLLVAEAHGLDGAGVCDNALDYLEQIFQRGNLSVSRRLLDGLKGVHQGLAADNRASLPEHRVTMGIAIAYAHGEDVYLTQAGGASAHLIDAQGGHELTAPPGGGQPEYLGGPRPPQLMVRRVRLQLGQRLVMLAGAGAAACDASLVPPFQDGPEAGMVALYKFHHGRRSLGALVMELPGAVVRERAPVRYGAALRSSEQRRPAVEPPADFDAPAVEATGRRVAISLRPPPIKVPNPLAGLIPPQAIAAVVGLMVLAALVLGAQAVLEQMGESSRQQTVAALQKIATLEGQAGAADSAGRKRELLTEAGSQLQSLLQRTPGQPEATTGLARVRKGLTDLDAIVRLTDLRVVADFGQVTGGNVLTRDLVATPSGLMVLDRASDRVLLVGPATQQGDGQRPVSTFAQSAARGRRNLGHLTWLPRAGAWPRDSLLSLDEGRGLLELAPNAEPRQLALRGAAEWESVAGMFGYNGILYVLDPKASQVWRYAPTDSGFDSNRQSAVPALDLRDAVDMVVDGDFYVLVRDGRVLKVSGGRILPFGQDGLDKPMLNPVAVTTTPEQASLFVLDQGNKRVIEFQKATGKFLRQYPIGELPTIHDLWVDRERNTLYLVSDRQLHAAGIPGG